MKKFIATLLIATTLTFGATSAFACSGGCDSSYQSCVGDPTGTTGSWADDVSFWSMVVGLSGAALSLLEYEISVGAAL